MKIVHFYWHPASKIAVRLPQDLHNYRLYFFQQNHAQLRETTVKHLFLNHSFCLLIPWSQAFVESGVLWIYHLLPLLLTHNIRGVRVEEYAYYVNKLRRNFGLETLKWRQIVTSQTAHTKYKWPPYVTAWNPPMEIFCARHCWMCLKLHLEWLLKPAMSKPRCKGRMRSCRKFCAADKAFYYCECAS